MIYIIFITTLIIQIGADSDPLVNYKCLGKDVLVVHSKTNDYVRMHCGTPQICGETRTCTPSLSMGLCNGKANYLMGVDENGDKSLRSTCCQYSPPVKSHSNDHCVTQEVHDHIFMRHGNESHGISKVGPLVPNPVLPAQPIPNPAVASELPSRGAGPTGNLIARPESGTSGNNIQSNQANADIGGSNNGIAELSLFKLTNKQYPLEVVKGIEKLPNGYRIISCFIECDQSTTTSITKLNSVASTSAPNKATTGAQVKASTEGSIKVSTSAPIKTSTVAPTKASTAGPIKASTAGSIKTSTQGSIKASTAGPIKASTAGPIKASTTESIKASTAGPIKASTAGPTKASTTEPIKASTAGSIKASTAGPTKASTAGPIKASTIAPIKEPTVAPEKPPTPLPHPAVTEPPSGGKPIGSGNNGTNGHGGNNGSQGIGGSAAGQCKPMSPNIQSLIQNIKQGNVKYIQGIPGYKEAGTYCSGSEDKGCLQKCLSVLKVHFLAAICDPSNSNCVCKQDKDGSNYDKNLKSFGLDVNNPTCVGVPINNNGGPGGSNNSSNPSSNKTSSGNTHSNGVGGTGKVAELENPLKGLPEPKEGKHFKTADIGCFSAEMLVKTPNGTKRMDELKVGDEVLVASTEDIASYQHVEWFYHRDPQLDFTFVTVITESNRRLSLTLNHLLIFVPCDRHHLTPVELYYHTMTNTKFSRRAEIGMCLPSFKDGMIFPDKIVTIYSNTKRGIFSPVTSSGTIIVNDIHASCYSTVENQLLQYTVHKFLIKLWHLFSPVLNFFGVASDTFRTEKQTDDVSSVLLYILEVARLILPASVY